MKLSFTGNWLIGIRNGYRAEYIGKEESCGLNGEAIYLSEVVFVYNKNIQKQFPLYVLTFCWITLYIALLSIATISCTAESTMDRNSEVTALCVCNSTACLPQQLVRVRVTLQLTVSQSVCLGVEPNLGLLTRDIYFFFLKVTVLSYLGRPLWRQVGSVICQSFVIIICSSLSIYIYNLHFVLHTVHN
jgi:hypothetical protein